MPRLQHLRSCRFRSWLNTVSSVALCGLAACASSGRSDAGKALLVTLNDFKSGSRFELASESHTERVEYYSGKRREAVRKVQTDEVMSAFVNELERLGLGTHVRAGRAPEISSSDVIRWGLELESRDRSVHWLIGTGSPAPEWQDFQQCRDMFLQLYNATMSYQAVQNESGKQYFEDKARAANDQKPGR